MSELPEDFAVALECASLAAFFADCTGAHRREYLKWIAQAKRPETRAAHVEQIAAIAGRGEPISSLWRRD